MCVCVFEVGLLWNKSMVCGMWGFQHFKGMPIYGASVQAWSISRVNIVCPADILDAVLVEKNMIYLVDLVDTIN